MNLVSKSQHVEKKGLKTVVSRQRSKDDSIIYEESKESDLAYVESSSDEAEDKQDKLTEHIVRDYFAAGKPSHKI